MAGVILETLNIRKLAAFGCAVLLIQIACFLVGGLIAPAPHSTEQILSLKCLDVDPGRNRKKWFFPRPRESNYTCKHHVQEISKLSGNIRADQIVFMFQFPLPKGGFQLDMSRWFQQIISILMLDITYEKGNEVGEDAELTMDVRLGYRNPGDADHDWKEIARSLETRPLKCSHTSKDEHVDDYSCEILPLFTLGSCHYSHYLINIRLPIDDKRNFNTKLGKLEDLWMVEIHQNGGFTMVWFALKTVIFPVNLLALLFFKRRVNQLPRRPNLLERTIFVLGIVISVLNCPVEWLSLKFNMPFWLILSDIRQGLLYCTLFCFWIVFTGEHLMDDEERNRMVYYWKQLLVVGCGSLSLLLFEVSERGVQLHNPFYSIWSNPVTAKMGFALVVVAGICASAYFIFLFYLVARALKQMCDKRRLLPNLPEARRRYYSGVIYRFSILIVYTLLCAALSVVFFIVSQVDEDSWKWGEKKLEYSSAFITGVYGMWNLYVFSLLCLYAPSHKFRSAFASDTSDSGAAFELRASATGGSSMGDPLGGATTISTVEPVCTTSEGIAFLQKTAQD